MDDNLSMGSIMSGGVKIGIKNFLSLLGAFILWLVTFWIPYLNVGTTIALMSIPLAMSKGKVISPTEIFDAKYRKYMGDFFLLLGLRSIVVFPALMFMIIPGIIVSIGYSLAVLILLDKEMDPSACLTESNKMMYGHKLSVFLAKLILVIPVVIPFLNFVYIFFLVPILLGVDAYLYQQLSGNSSETKVEGVIDQGI